MGSHPTPAADEPLARLLARTTVRSAMQLGLYECDPDADVRTLARTMAERRIHAVVVPGVERPEGPLGRSGWGLVPDVALMRALRPGQENTTAGQLASTEIVVVLPTDMLEHAAQLMAEHDTAHLVVVSPHTGRPVGMISSLDIAAKIAAP